MSQRVRAWLDAIRHPTLFDVPFLGAATDAFAMLARPRRDLPPETGLMALFLSLDPPIFCSQPRPKPFGAADHFAARHPRTPFVFLHPLTQSHERATRVMALALHRRRFLKDHPRARLIAMANTPGEMRLLERFGIEARLVPQNMLVDETMYAPIPGRVPRFDAIYNAQIAPFKRHHLARAVPTCAYVTKLFDTWSPALKRRQLDAFVANLPQGHVILNDVILDGLADGDVAKMNHLEVNEALASAHVGLCLSRQEGAMYASIEYLLAGLPVVSTGSRGGRDAFFHPDTALIVPDDPRAVRDGVAAMKARAIPREAVRAITLRLMGAERERFNAFIDALRGRSVERTDPRWSFAWRPKLTRHGTVAEFEAELAASPR